MKRTFSTLLFSMSAALAFADEPAVISTPVTESKTISESESLPSLGLRPPKVEKISDRKKSIVYLKMSAADSTPTDSFQVIPGIGLGYRLSSGHSAIDLSASYTGGRGLHGKHWAHYYTLPKANYLYYLTPESSQSLYAGAGLAWGGLRTKEDHRFNGIIPNATLGYEMHRTANWRSFVQLDVSQPAVAASVKGKDGLPGPFAELSVGAGF